MEAVLLSVFEHTRTSEFKDRGMEASINWIQITKG